jgi:uncharacterized protein (TIGR02594 family)
MAKYIVTTSVLRIRSGPGTTFSIIGTLNKNTIIQGAEIQSDWVHITTADNKTGWSHRNYLQLLDETPPPPSGTAYRVDASTLNIRLGAGTNFGVIGSLKKGEIVEGLAITADNQWVQIHKAIGNITGWSSLKYMTKVVPPPPPGPTDVQMIVTTDLLNYRSGPGDGYPITGQVLRSEMVVFLEASPDWKWVNFKTSTNATGWASSKYLMEKNDLIAAPEDYVATGWHRALSDTLSLRQEPSETSKEIAPMKFNRVVKVDAVSPDGKWKHCTNAWGQTGWYPIERLAKLSDEVLQQYQTEFPWLSVAYAEFGTREIPGAKHNPRIVEYLMSTDLAQKYPSLPDETDWCAGFVNWCVEKAKLPSTNSALVHPWRNWGKASGPQRGAVITFLWDDGWAHVSFYLGEVGNYVICLGGNQSDAVWFSVYHKKYVTSYRVA